MTKTKRNRKWKILHSFRETNLVPQPIKELQIKSKTVTSYSLCKKKKTFFVPFILCKGNIFQIWVLSQCIVYWITHFQKINTFTYQKILLHALLLLLSKIDESLQCILLILHNPFLPIGGILPLFFFQIWGVATVFYFTMHNRFILIFLSLWCWFSTVIAQSRFIVQFRFGNFLAF